MPRIAEIAIACPLRQTFDYLIESDFADIQVGYRVKIPFGSREVIGFVIAIKETTTQKVKAITHCFEQEPVITHELAQLIQWTSYYYHHPIGDCYQVALPKKIRLGGDNKLKTVSSWSLSKNDLPDKFLGEKQQAIVDLLLQSVNKTLLQTQIYEQLGSCLSTLNRLAELGVITT